MKCVYGQPKCMPDIKSHYCAGCGHGIVHKLIGQAIDEFGLHGKVIFIAPVGCSVLGYYYFNEDGLEAAHGRAPAVSTGVKRVHKDKIVICYQGDGDLLAIGTAETVHAANRGEHITVIFVNNAIYGMTGGQMAPTTLDKQKTRTSPYGRNPEDVGFPIRACEIINTLEKPVFIERCTVDTPKNILKAKKAIFKAVENQVSGKGYSFVEIVSMCPTGWGMKPVDAVKWMQDNMLPYFRVGNFRNR